MNKQKCTYCGQELSEEDSEYGECPYCHEKTEEAEEKEDKEEIINILNLKDKVEKNNTYNTNQERAEAIVKEKKRMWLAYHKCPKCNFRCVHHISKNNHSYWICNLCDNTYNDNGRFKFRWGFD